MMTNVIFETYKSLLAELVSFRSVSTDTKYLPEINKTVAWLERQLADHGFATQIWTGKTTNPVVFGSYEVDPDLETVLIYGHYDVQPAGGTWQSDPWTLTECAGKLFARGVVDNKGQFLIHVATAF